ncbi:uncharacterized protein LOC142225499 [Haematobia irritans]|uniref:uncharacterized protein LOC142225499 n=1 Tax=Haematobia irritans TaxID=7368 RepID=UPI003F4FAF7F
MQSEGKNSHNFKRENRMQNFPEGRPFDLSRDLYGHNAVNNACYSPPSLRGRPFNLAEEVERGKLIGRHACGNRRPSTPSDRACYKVGRNKLVIPRSNGERLSNLQNESLLLDAQMSRLNKDASPLRKIRPSLDNNISYKIPRQEPQALRSLPYTSQTPNRAKATSLYVSAHSTPNTISRNHETPVKRFILTPQACSTANRNLRLIEDSYDTPSDIISDAIPQTRSKGNENENRLLYGDASPSIRIWEQRSCPVEKIPKGSLSASDFDISFAAPIADSTHYQDFDEDEDELSQITDESREQSTEKEEEESSSNGMVQKPQKPEDYLESHHKKLNVLNPQKALDLENAITVSEDEPMRASPITASLSDTLPKKRLSTADQEVKDSSLRLKRGSKNNFVPNLLYNSLHRRTLPRSFIECSKKCVGTKFNSSIIADVQNARGAEILKIQLANLVEDTYCPGLIQATLDGRENFNDISLNLFDKNCQRRQAFQDHMTLLEAFSVRVDKDRNATLQELSFDTSPESNSEARIEEILDKYYSKQNPSELNNSVKSLLMSEAFETLNRRDETDTSLNLVDIHKNESKIPAGDTEIISFSYVGRLTS